MNVREAARDPVQSNRLHGGKLAVFEAVNSETYLIGEAVEVER